MFIVSSNNLNFGKVGSLSKCVNDDTELVEAVTALGVRLSSKESLTGWRGWPDKCVMKFCKGNAKFFTWDEVTHASV